MPFLRKYTGPLRTAARKKISAVAVAVDAYFKYVTMLLHGDGTNGAQNNTFLDSSTNNFTITRNGNTTQGSFSPYGSNWSNYFDGSGDYLLFDDNAGLEIGTNSFTFEAWIYLTAYSAAYGSPAQYLATVGAKEGTNGSVSYRLVVNGTSNSYTELICQIYSNDSTSVSTTASYSFALNTWYHVAAVRNGTTVTLYVNGTSIGSGTNATNSQNTSAPFRVGSIGYTNFEYYFPGYISNLRLVNGTAVYTSNFTPPTAPLTAITNTGILTCQSNRFIDNSTNNAAVTVYGNSSVQRFNPFGASTAYSTSVIGGSGYFDGSGDYLTAASTTAFDIASGTDFTFSCWVYFTSNPNNGTVKYIFDQTSTSGSGSVIFLAQETNNAWTACSMANAYSSSDFVAGQWYWITISRVSGTLRSFKNGTLITSGANTDASDTNRFTIAARYSNNFILNSAYLTDVRFVVGSGVTSDTVPTAPASPITNTALLCNMTNGAIFDNAMMNDLETVGNAQISTSVKKYGTASMYFDGTGDYLRPNSQLPFVFNTGDFTIEFWVYANSVSGWVTFLDNRPSTTGSGFFLGYNAGFQYYSGASNLISGGTLSTSTWTHVALCRASGSVRIFVNGTQVGSTATDTSNYSTSTVLANGPFIGANYVPSDFLNGYLDDFRVTKYARYTANFTPPTAAFADISSS